MVHFYEYQYSMMLLFLLLLLQWLLTTKMASSSYRWLHHVFSSYMNYFSRWVLSLAVFLQLLYWWWLQQQHHNKLSNRLNNITGKSLYWGKRIVPLVHSSFNSGLCINAPKFSSLLYINLAHSWLTPTQKVPSRSFGTKMFLKNTTLHWKILHCSQKCSGTVLVHYKSSFWPL